MKKILMIAFHYPPYRGSSGIQRTLKFSRYLPDHGWKPLVLSADPKAYPQVGDDQMGEIPDNVPVKRAFALDASRHLSIRGFFLRWTALPDRWVSWLLGAVPAGLSWIRKEQPEVLWSTHPIATAHLIGLVLHRLTGVPWVADFRDSMLEDEYPSDPSVRRSYRWIERKVVEHATLLVFTTPSAMRMYLGRYPGLSRDRCVVIPNGYDEEDFKDIKLSDRKTPNEGPMRLLHAGLIYQGERDPRQFFRAVARLKKDGRIGAETVTIDLRASGSEKEYSAIIRELGIGDLVYLLPPLPYREALQDCAESDGLLLFQAASCNHLIPAKVYEYLRLRKPILAMTADGGDTAELLRRTGGATIVDLADEEAIYRTFPSFLKSVREGLHPLPDDVWVRSYARENQALELAKTVSRLIGAEGRV